MAGITDLPFRRVVAQFGAGLLVSEMVASNEVLIAKPMARARAELGFGETATAVQLAGRDSVAMAEAARWAEGQGARIIDINMGCPSKRVTTGLCGAALLQDPDQALRLIEAVVGAVSVPVTLKTRLGWDEATRNTPDLVRRAEAAGIAMVSIHGRTRSQFYKGKADWTAIRAVKEATTLPVIANGDIVDAATASQALHASGADGVMIGRGAQGAPWRLAEVASALTGGAPVVVPRGSALADLMLEHHARMLDFYGTDLGLRMARKHLGWYLDGLAVPHDLRRKLLTTEDAATVRLLVPVACESDPVLTRLPDSLTGAAA